MAAAPEPGRREAAGRLFDGRSARPVDVVIALGERSLVILGTDRRPLAHWPLASLRALNERGDASLQLVPAADSDERVVLEDFAMIRALEAVSPALYRRPVDRRGFGRALGWAGAAVAAVLLVVFVVVPALSDRLALLIPPEREQALGDAVADQVRQVLAYFDPNDRTPAFCAAPEGVAALDALSRRVDPAAGLPYPLRVSVLDHGMVNAFALPGGRVVLFRGLLDVAESPEEVAGVLAHEIGHVVHRDPTRGVLRTAGTAGILGLLVGDVFGASMAVTAGEAMLNASYQRDAEMRADEVAYRLLANADLPVAPFARFFERMVGQHEGDEGDGNGDRADAGPLRYFRSHPGLAGRAERAAAADGIGEGPFEPALDADAWAALKRICTERQP